jgi:hypothetical protein
VASFNVISLDAVVLGIGGLLYTVTVAIIAIVSVFSRAVARRQDARDTLCVLLRKNHSGKTSATKP